MYLKGEEMKPLMTKVKSSNIDSIGYDITSKMLYVTFKGGGMYSYTPFSESAFDNFKKAKSKGQWFHKHVKDNAKYTVQKVF
jgi:hypothetical protein